MSHYASRHQGRSIKIDALRGIAVLGMIFAHALFFFHDGSNSTFVFLEKITNTSALTIFVFVSGQALSKWLDAHAQDHPKKIFLLSFKRATIYYLAYAVVAIATLIIATSGTSQIIPTLLFMTPPRFTEYIPLFTILALSAGVLRPLLRYTRTSMLLTFLIGGFFYLAGITLYQFPVPNFLISLKALFAGSKELLRFPVLFYIPVWLWGLWWQHDVDHIKQDKSHTARHLWLIFGVISFSITSVILTRFYNIPLLDPSVRWPPSISFLAVGMSIGTIGIFLMPSFAWTGQTLRRIIAYFGRDALDIWVSHIILLLLYQRFVTEKFGNPIIVLSLLASLMFLTVLLSSTVLTNRVYFPLNITFSGTTRFRKRYAIYALTGLVLLLMSVSFPLGKYGGFLRDNALTIQPILPSTIKAQLKSRTLWYVKHNSAQSIELILTTQSKETTINPDLVEIRLNSKVADFASVAASDGTLHFTKPLSDISPGTYPVTARIHNGDNWIETNTIIINVSEPLLVAWTFDWEGWDVSDEALQRITRLSAQYPTIKFTHFVSPRTFLPGNIPEERQAELIKFLNNRYTFGDEIAMHLHMHYDFVSAAGITPRTSNPWGLRTEEGYDIPTSEYTTEEFRTLVTYAQNIATQVGLPPMKGYRAGGWYLNTDQLHELKSLGFEYDSSGRSKPLKGAFKNTPWNLNEGAQPYFPSLANQNRLSQDSTTILEIPSNGLSTYDQSIEDLESHIASVYQGGFLSTPRTLVFVSHPQFYEREFSKISPILQRINQISEVADRGPAIFATTGDISTLWNTLSK